MEIYVNEYFEDNHLNAGWELGRSYFLTEEDAMQKALDIEEKYNGKVKARTTKLELNNQRYSHEHIR